MNDKTQADKQVSPAEVAAKKIRAWTQRELEEELYEEGERAVAAIINEALTAERADHQMTAEIFKTERDMYKAEHAKTLEWHNRMSKFIDSLCVVDINEGKFWQLLRKCELLDETEALHSIIQEAAARHTQAQEGEK